MSLCLSGHTLAQEPERGISVSLLGSDFVAGESGPTVVTAPMHPETRYSDTFGTGAGLTAHYFRQMGTIFRWQAGIVYRNWPGQYFEGGEFQPGWEYGVAGQFDDLSLIGAYGGVTVIRQRDHNLRPFASIDLAIVQISELNVVTSGDSQPYWKSVTKDFLTLKGGLSYSVSPRADILFHAGMSILAQPESVDIFSSGTAGTSVDVGIGISYTF